jgi:hypothetical protein
VGVGGNEVTYKDLKEALAPLGSDMKCFIALQNIPCLGYTIRRGDKVYGYDFGSVVKLRIAEMVITVTRFQVQEVKS